MNPREVVSSPRVGRRIQHLFITLTSVVTLFWPPGSAAGTPTVRTGEKVRRAGAEHEGEAVSASARRFREKCHTGVLAPGASLGSPEHGLITFLASKGPWRFSSSTSLLCGEDKDLPRVTRWARSEAGERT